MPRLAFLLVGSLTGGVCLLAGRKGEMGKWKKKEADEYLSFSPFALSPTRLQGELFLPFRLTLQGS
jgi:hypothetical protein